MRSSMAWASLGLGAGEVGEAGIRVGVGGRMAGGHRRSRRCRRTAGGGSRSVGPSRSPKPANAGRLGRRRRGRGSAGAGGSASGRRGRPPGAARLAAAVHAVEAAGSGSARRRGGGLGPGRGGRRARARSSRRARRARARSSAWRRLGLGPAAWRRRARVRSRRRGPGFGPGRAAVGSGSARLARARPTPRRAGLGGRGLVERARRRLGGGGSADPGIDVGGLAVRSGPDSSVPKVAGVERRGRRRPRPRAPSSPAGGDAASLPAPMPRASGSGSELNPRVEARSRRAEVRGHGLVDLVLPAPRCPGGARLMPGGGVGAPRAAAGAGAGPRARRPPGPRPANSSSSAASASASSIFCQVATPSGGGLARSRLRALRHSFSCRLVSLGTTTRGLRAVFRTPPAVTAQGTQYGGLAGPNGYTRQSAQKGPPQLRHRPSAAS